MNDEKVTIGELTMNDQPKRDQLGAGAPTKTAVPVTTANQGIATRAAMDPSVPAYMANSKNSQTTGTIGMTDVVVPRLKICQGLSEDKEKLGMKDGDWYNSAAAEVYGKSLDFFILVRFSSRVWFEKGTKKMLALETDELRVVDGRLERVGMVRIGKDADRIINDHYEEGNDCDNYVVVTERAAAQSLLTKQLPEYAVYTAMKAARTYTKQLNLKLKNNGRKGVPIYGQLVHSENIKDSFPAGDAWMPDFTYPRFASQVEFGMLEEFFPLAVELTKKVSSASVETAEPADHE
jgi:hypothetical protein